MRARVKKICSGERVNYLASVSDLMSGLLFVFILALTVAIIQTKHSAQEAKEAAMQMESIQARLKNVEARLVGTREATGNLLDRLQKELVKENVMVEIDPARSVLRIPENAVSFEVGRSDLNEENAERIRMIGRVLADKVLCYQKNVPETMRERCAKENPFGHTLDAIFIEGHTDNLAYRGTKRGVAIAIFPRPAPMRCMGLWWSKTTRWRISPIRTARVSFLCRAMVPSVPSLVTDMRCRRMTRPIAVLNSASS